MSIKLKIGLVLLLVIGLINITLWGIDSSSLPIKQGNGIITSKSITYSYTPLLDVGRYEKNISSYNVVITLNGLSDTITLCKSDYDLLTEGTSITCYYSTGRVFNTLYVSFVSIEI